MMRAILLASATATTFLGFSSSIRRSQGSVTSPRRMALEMTDVAPRYRSLLMSRWTHLRDSPQPLAATRRGFTRREPYPCPEVAPRAEALHRWRKGVDRHRRELSHPRDRHQAPERLVFPHDPTDLPVHLIDLRIQVVDPLDEEAYRGGYQHREELLTLRVRLFQPPDVVDPERKRRVRTPRGDPAAH